MNHKEVIDKLYTLPKGTEFWLIPLQENVIFTRDMIVKLTNTCYGSDYVFCNIQIKHDGSILQFFTGKDMTTFSDKTNGEIGISKSKLIKYE